MAANPVAGNGAPAAPAHHEHSRKTSVTITSQGSVGHPPNGNPATPTTRPNMVFGSMPVDNAPAIANSNSYHQSSSSLSAVQDNPRINSPAASPSPIPQPSASGGRPPERTQPQNNNLHFGAMGEAGSNNHLPPSAPGVQAQGQHYRRASSHSQHGEMPAMSMSPGVSRGGYMNGPARGGRGYNGYGPPQTFSPGHNFRAMQTPSRNGPGFSLHLQNQMPPHTGSPHGPPRSPAPMSTQPGTPNMQHMQMHGQQPYPPYQGYPQQVPSHPNHYQGQPDFQYANYYSQPYPMHPNFMNPASQPPRGQGYKPQPAAGHPQYGHAPFNQPPSQNMSRTSSQMSERPASSIGSSQQPAAPTAPNAQVSHGHSQSTSAAPTSSNFQRPNRSSRIIIKKPDGEVVTFDKKSSPAPTGNAAAQSPALTTPSPSNVSSNTASATTAPSHSRTESKSVKSADDIRLEFMENVKREQEKEKSASQDKPAEVVKSADDKVPSKASSDESAPATTEPSSKPTEPSSKPTEPLAEEPAKDATEDNAKDSAKATPAEGSAVASTPAPAPVDAKPSAAPEEESAEAKKAREDEEFERMIAEMEAKEREEEERENAFKEKRKAEAEAQAAKDKEAANMDDEKMRQAERDAEAREEERARGKSSTQDKVPGDAESQRLFASLKKPALGPGADDAPSPEPEAPASKAAEDNDAMPPPSRSGKSVGISRPKPPAALKLETNKSVEPAQPTPGMRALRSARMLQLQTETVKYPEGIQSPNPALNQSSRRGGRLYETSFLLQFQDVFKEKPSVDWEQKVKETLGDSNDNGPKSARGSASATPGGRGSQRGPPAGFPQQSMGNFGAGAGPRRSMPSAGAPMYDPAKSMGSFGRGPFGGPGMGRAPSAQAMSHGGHSQRGSSNRGSKAGPKVTLKQQEQMNSKMPLTAGADLKPLEASNSGWKPMSLGRPSASTDASGNMAPDMVQRKVKSHLNKMTPERFDKIADQIMQIAGQSRDEMDGRTLRQVIALTFEKACDEAHWASMYAQFCQRMLREMSDDIKDENVRDKSGAPVVGGNLFRKYLLNRCQEEFERGWVINLPENPEGQSDEAAMLSDEYYKAAAAKRKGLGLVQFIGELYKLRMLSIKIMHQCLLKLLDFEGEPDEASIESLVKLLRTVGATMEMEAGGPALIKAYFERIDKIMTDNKLPSRLHFMLLDIIDLKKTGWQDKNAQKGPKTIQEIREEALAQQQRAEVERQQKQNQRGGGRMPSGRQDSRNFPGNIPPPADYNRTTLGSDDLRKLNQKRESRDARLGPNKTLGPSSMLGSRSSSGRQGFGPPSMFSRSDSQAGSSPGGSGLHSRTASIKADPKKEEDTKTNANAFSALEGMNEDGNGPSSPPQTKSTPATDAKTAD